MKRIKLFTGLMGLALVVPPIGAAELINIPSKEEQPARAKFSKEQLIDSLKKMHSRPRDIATVSAMCYKMAILPKDVEYHCKVCGSTSIYERSSDQGVLVDRLPYVERSLAVMPYDMVIDSSGLCSKCGKGKNKDLLITVSCFNCGKHFNWEVKTHKDVDLLHWLYLKPPIKEIDITELQYSKPEEGAVYIRDHVFCPECREKININE